MVVERRHQIGVMRAIGYSRSTVQFSFLLESSLIAVMGIVIGLSLGLLVAAEVVADIGRNEPDIVLANSLGKGCPCRRRSLLVLASDNRYACPERCASLARGRPPLRIAVACRQPESDDTARSVRDLCGAHPGSVVLRQVVELGKPGHLS